MSSLFPRDPFPRQLPMSSFMSPLALLGLLTFSSAAFAQSSDLPDDILAPTEDSASQERQQLLAEEADVDLPKGRRNRRVIQTFQRKSFMKIGRYEIAPQIGFVTNDPFANRYIVGGAVGYHITEVLGFEVAGGFSPDLGTADWKPIVAQLREFNNVSPEISKLLFYVNANFQFSPIYGKLAVGRGGIINFDIFGTFGTGIANTIDDAEAFEADENDREFIATQVQTHPTLNYGGGVRVILSEGFAFRFEGRGISYIEVLEGTNLEMKNSFTVLAGASLFFPGMK